MTRFKDLTPYTYFPRGEPAGSLNIGWLDSDDEYTHGHVDKMIVDAIRTLCLSPVNRTRGYYACRLCRPHAIVSEATTPGESFTLGSGEICVPGSDGISYVAPNMLSHYIVVHRYQPPEEFLGAMRALIAAQRNRRT